MGSASEFSVLHLSTAHIGGAGIAARRLNSALNEAGYPSIFLAIESKSFTPSSTEQSVRRPQIKRLWGAVTAKLNSNIASDTYFTLFNSPALNYRHFAKYNSASTIIHIHNWFNLGGIRLFRELLENNFKLVFTLHDMRLFTGGCHYSLSCKNFSSGCHNCPAIPKFLQALPPLNLIEMKDLFDEFEKQISVICPSLWLKNSLDSSLLINSKYINFIPNHHNILNRYSPNLVIKRKDLTRINLGIASLDINSKLKGGDLLNKIITYSKRTSGRVNFLFLSEFDKNGKSQDLFWDEIDYLLVASRADNSPNVIHEAKFRGIPIISTGVGGIHEMMNDAFDLKINFADLDPENFLKIVDKLRESLNFNRPRIQDAQFIKYIDGALEKTIEVYSNLISRS